MKFRSSISISVVALLVLTLAGCKQSDPVEGELFLVWSDEFDGTELDDNKWEAMIGDGSNYGLWLWGNNEEQYYRAENATVSGGYLKIKAQAQEFGGQDYTSARIRTKEKGDFKYGRVEASIRMDAVGGLWHAFWMLPTDAVASWPVSGEIDIMEYVGNQPDEVLTTLHFADQFGNHQYEGEPHAFVNQNDFHEFAMEWDENEIVWFIDDEKVYTLFRPQIATWPFDAQFHILLNVAVGGNLGGEVNQAALSVPRYMYVDYVRVYQRQQES
ncbi:MAG: glycoside hydrolase family 16 protein [Flavobacteriales bacterium]|nr:glycoside hydrolase family 16 protein [Flavobacteriales bacterium]